jgi:hypothetical protein
MYLATSSTIDLEFGCVPSPIMHKCGLPPYPLTVGLAVHQARTVRGLEMIIDLMLGHKALFVYFYNF